MHHYLVKDISHYCNVTLLKYGALTERPIPFYDFSFILDGSMTYYADGVKILLKKNDAIFLPPGTIRTREAAENTVHFVSFNFTAMEDAFFSFPLYMPNCINANIRKLVSLYPPSHLSSFYYSKEKCINMLNYILLELAEASELTCNNEHVMKILHYIEEHITENLTLQTISAKMNLSREYTSYIFKKEMDKTLTAYVNERKLLLAKELIIDGAMTLTDIASYLGYENYNYFSRIFKQNLGITPIALKQKIHDR
ncbi:MAG: helix-turn-helix domain-containing protein [Lachnospiraceae bacterium]|nr:helix-turn-helix domain-containing protein [Lachnospiraceae bacterium]MBR3807239.1 helix-turn-helix domain-containing protein [Lachnospiraceae bacterium]